MGNNYDSTIYCISTSETTNESLIFQAKGTWESIKSIYAQFRSERKETLRRRGLPPAWQLFEAKGWEYKQGGFFWLFSYRCQHNYSDTGPFLLLVTLIEECAITVKIWPFFFLSLSFEHRPSHPELADNSEGKSGRSTAEHSLMSALI